MFVKKIRLLCMLAVATITFSISTMYIKADGIETEVSYTGPTALESSLQVTLYEKYNQEYGLYEESMGDMFFFYSNVGNGSFSSKPVMLDIPENVNYELEKNGVVIPYLASQEIAEVGNYVLRLTGVYEATSYSATFRFTIRTPEIEQTEETAQTEPLADEQSVTDAEESLVIDENDEIDTEHIKESIEEQGNALESDENIIALAGASSASKTGFSQALDIVTQTYRLSMVNGTIVKSNVPSGAIVNNAVNIEIPEGVTATVKKDGEEYEFAGLNFEEPGFYKISFYESSMTFSMVYAEEKDYPFITFRIVDGPVNDISMFNSPRGMHITNVTVDGEYVFDRNAILESNLTADEPEAEYLDYYWMKEDGVYGFTLADDGDNISYTVSITRDTQAPTFNANIKNSVLSLEYLCDDIESYYLEKDGIPVESFSPLSIQGKGSYVYSIKDKAGNETTITFSLGNSINSASIVAVILIIVVLGFVGFVVRASQTVFRVR